MRQREAERGDGRGLEPLAEPRDAAQVSDVPDLVSEADTNIEDGVAGDHVGYWERPGNDNNRAYADLAGAKMDRRMRSDAAGAQFWQTKGTDFFDTDALYSPFTDGDDTLSSGWGSQYDNTFPGTGGAALPAQAHVAHDDCTLFPAVRVWSSSGPPA